MLCPLCQEEEGTHQHVYWWCQHGQCRAIRKKLAPAIAVAKKANFSGIVKRGKDAAEDEWRWTRGLIADPLAGYTWGTGNDLVLTNGAAEEVNGMAVLDGSLKMARSKN